MKSEIIFTGNKKIPSCHAATICEYGNGNLAAAWFAGSKEGDADTVIMGSQKSEEKNWSKPCIWVNVFNKASGNPRIFEGPDKRLWLITPINYGKWCKGGTRLFLKRSYKDYKRWYDLELFFDKPGILGKNKPLRLTNGNWILPIEDEVKWRPGFLISDDEGQSWHIIMAPSGNKRVIQPTVVQLSDDTLLAYLRSWEGKIFSITSEDNGLSWSKPKATVFPNNNSGIDMLRLNSGNLILVYNRSDLGKKNERGQRSWGPRNPLNLALSPDEGKSWPYELILEEKEHSIDYFNDLTNIDVPSSGEYSYPAVIQDSKENIHIVYTYKRIGIKHITLTEEEIFKYDRY